MLWLWVAFVITYIFYMQRIVFYWESAYVVCHAHRSCRPYLQFSVLCNLQVGVYAATVNGLNIGAFMEKGLSMAAGQTPVQAYWFKLLDLIKEGKLTPHMVITHELPLTEAAHGYKIFNEKLDNCVKVVLKPGQKAAA